MPDSVAAAVEPLVRRGLFASTEEAIAELTREYVVRQIERHQTLIKALESKYRMKYEQFDDYLKSRSESLEAWPDTQLNEAIMAEEEDGLDWKQAREMLASWPGLRTEVGG